MSAELLESYLLTKKGADKCYPFGKGVAVFKVMGKMFALFAEKESPLRINLKCDPDEASLLRGMFEAVKPGYHMNKDHWNTVVLDGTVAEDILLDMIDKSYALVVKGLRRVDREKLNLL
jgi:predicted DNA-binding protein (MmcQ/YjbR family)